MTHEEAARQLAQIRELVNTDDDGPEGSMGPRWILGQVQEILDGPNTEPRKNGCECQWEEGDSPCRVHGEESS